MSIVELKKGFKFTDIKIGSVFKLWYQRTKIFPTVQCTNTSNIWINLPSGSVGARQCNIVTILWSRWSRYCASIPSTGKKFLLSKMYKPTLKHTHLI